MSVECVHCNYNLLDRHLAMAKRHFAHHKIPVMMVRQDLLDHMVLHKRSTDYVARYQDILYKRESTTTTYLSCGSCKLSAQYRSSNSVVVRITWTALMTFQV